MHGTTVSTNALVQRKLAKTALITTKGFRDIIEMRRSLKIETKSMYEAYIPPYEPIVPRYLRFTVDREDQGVRRDSHARWTKKSCAQVLERIKKQQVEAVAICFINSYANSANELRAAEICSGTLARGLHLVLQRASAQDG